MRGAVEYETDEAACVIVKDRLITKTGGTEQDRQVYNALQLACYTAIKESVMEPTIRDKLDAIDTKKYPSTCAKLAYAIINKLRTASEDNRVSILRRERKALEQKRVSASTEAAYSEFMKKWIAIQNELPSDLPAAARQTAFPQPVRPTALALQ